MAAISAEKEQPMPDPKRLEPESSSKAPPVFPTAPATANERIRAFPWSVDIGTFVVGSSHPSVLVVPDAPAGQHADAIVSRQPMLDAVSRPEGQGVLDDARARAQQMADAFSSTSPAQRTSDPIAIRFAPQSRGRHQAEVDVLLRWSDGLMDLRKIRVFANARRIDDAPAKPIEQVQPGPVANEAKLPTADLEGVSKVHENALGHAKEDAQVARQLLGDEQKRGLGLAEKHALSYQQLPPPKTWWSNIAEIALAAAVGGIAGLAARVAAAKLAGTVTSVAARFVKDGVQAKQYAEVLVADTVKDGLKQAARSAGVKGAFTEAAAVVTPAATDGKRESPNPATSFFEMQQKALNALNAANGYFVNREHERLQHVLRTDPVAAIARMVTLEQAMLGATEHAAEIQKTHAQHHWVSLVARGSHGASDVTVHGERRKTTKLGGFELGAGLLRIHADVDGAGMPTNVRSARIDGISQEIADELLEQNLSRVPIPLMIEKGRGEFITRDEAGRVRVVVSRWTADMEPQRIHAAEQFVDGLLARSLRAWGLDRIKTDDTTDYVRVKEVK
jgi:hypothetical protein